MANLQKLDRSEASHALENRQAVGALAGRCLVAEIDRVRQLHRELGLEPGCTHFDPKLRAVDQMVAEMLQEGEIDASEMIIRIRQAGPQFAWIFPPDVWGALFRLLS